VNSVGGLGDQGLDEHAGFGGAAGGGQTGDHERGGVAARRGPREIFRRDEDFARGFEPVFAEGALEASDRIALDADDGVPPLRLFGLAVEPLVGKTGAADEANGAIHDGQFAMRAVIGARPGIPAHGVIPANATAQLAKCGEAAVGEGGTSDSVDDHPHLHAGAGALVDRVEDLVGNAAFLEDIGR